MKLVQFKNGKYFFPKRNVFSDSPDILFFSAWRGVHKPDDEKLVTLYDLKNMFTSKTC